MLAMSARQPPRRGVIAAFRDHLGVYALMEEKVREAKARYKLRRHLGLRRTRPIFGEASKVLTLPLLKSAPHPVDSRRMEATGAVVRLEVNDFIQGTLAMGTNRKDGVCPGVLGLNPPEDGANNKGPSSLTPTGDATVMDTEMEVSKHTASPDSIQAPDNGYGMFSPRKNKNDIQSIVWDTDNGHYKLSGGILGIGTAPKECDSNPKPDPHQAANSVWNSPVSGFESFAEKIKKSNEITGPQVDEDGFTKVTRRKKLGPIKVQSKKQKPVRIRAAPQQNDHVRTFGKQAPAGQIFRQLGRSSQAIQTANKPAAVLPPTAASTAPKKGSSGFNFARAIQGDRGVKKHQQPCASMDSQPSYTDFDTTNRFSVLDIPSSLKLNKLIEAQDDLYPPVQGLEDDMELDMIRSNDGQIKVGQPSQLRCGDQGVPPDLSPVCQVNREFREGVRILPSSIITPPKESRQPFGHEVTSAHPVREDNEEKDYGISDAQKLAITSRLNGPAQAVRAVDMDMWEQGEHVFFEDQVKALGLDYDYCIEDVESDDENGTAQFFSAQMKVGMPKVSLGDLGDFLSEVAFSPGFLFRFSKGIMNPSLPEPDLVEKPPDPLVSPFSGPNSGRRSSSRLALNSLSRKAKDTSGSHVGGKGHTTFVKLNLDDFVNEATANTLINNQNSHQVGEGMSNRIEGDGPNGDDLGLKFSVNGVAMAIDSPVDREAGRFPLPDSSGLVLGDLGLSPCNRPLIPSDVNVCPMNTNISAPPSPFNTDSLGMSSDGIGSESDITPDGSHNQTHQETIESSRKVDFRTLSRNESLDTVTPDPTVISPMLAPVNPDPFRLTQNKIPSTNVWNRNGANRVTKKHRRTKVKIISNNLSQNRGKIIVNNKVPKSRDSPIVSAPGSSSDPIIQKKMGELHQKFEKSKMPQLRMQNVVPNNQTNPIQPNAPNRKASPKFPPSTTSLPQPRIPAQPKFAGKNASVVHPQSVSHQYVAHGDGVAGIPTSNPFTALDVDMPDAGNSGNMDVAALADEGINEAIKFYEFSPENIADVLHFNPSKLTVPRIHDLSQPPDEPILMDEISDEEIPDFNITNAQKIAICESLEKYGAVKADVQANWEHGEWEFFHYQVKLLNIDPETCIEDVDSDSNETAQFFKSQMQQGAPGSSVNQAHKSTGSV
ncbi:hypothetical protein L1987_47750 [Smallanthus sonchifolius]|uniref:Uncharacterized protein n=1 Tax=Smallanthus sonchifolius TaxID=185202 RepID=A0ACB9G3A7_9ASTR|nr:hypothetical protein L1987_47750 [Smallanthus sonchifolius]